MIQRIVARALQAPFVVLLFAVAPAGFFAARVVVARERRQMARTVLVIDDAAEVLALARIFLSASGQWRVLTASSAEAGLEVALRERPEVVLIDVRMPGIGGVGVLEQLKQRADWNP